MNEVLNIWKRSHTALERKIWIYELKALILGYGWLVLRVGSEKHVVKFSIREGFISNWVLNLSKALYCCRSQALNPREWLCSEEVQAYKLHFCNMDIIIHGCIFCGKSPICFWGGVLKATNGSWCWLIQVDVKGRGWGYSVQAWVQSEKPFDGGCVVSAASSSKCQMNCILASLHHTVYLFCNL